MPVSPSARLAGPPQPAAESIAPVHVLAFALCDATASGAEDAQVRLARGDAVLSLCSHHFAVHELALLTTGWKITHDNRHQLR